MHICEIIIGLPGCAEAATPAGVLAQGLVSLAGRAGGRAGGLAAAAAAGTGTEKTVPFTTADKRQALVLQRRADASVARRRSLRLDTPFVRRR